MLQASLRRALAPLTIQAARPVLVSVQPHRFYSNEQQQQQDQDRERDRDRDQPQNRLQRRHDRDRRRELQGYRDRDVDNWFGGFWDDFGFPSAFPSLRDPNFQREIDKSFDFNKQFSSWRPRTSITETKEGDVVVTADMPGLSKEDVKVDLKNGVLTIKGTKKSEETKEGGGSSKQKRSYYSSFTLPEDVDATGIKAKMEHGVLEVTIPKPKEKEAPSTTVSIE